MKLEGAEASHQPDPEAQAGQALRRLRLARNWSQEQVAARMTAYGYDLHQTMIAKIEAAQRPLRVRELADFAALFGVEVQDLIHPPTGSLAETDQEIAQVTARRDVARERAAAARHQLDSAHAAVHDAQAAYDVIARESAVLEARLTSLLAERQKLLSWESDEGHSASEDEGRTRRHGPGTPGVSAAPPEGPTILRILLGIELRRLREAKQITVQQAGLVIRGSQSKIRRLEAGQIPLRDRDFAGLLKLYEVTDKSSRERLRSLARHSNVHGWWHDYSDILPSSFKAFVQLEEAAVQIRTYEVQFIPGLLQTKDYARAVTPLVDYGARDTEIDQKVQLGMARQAVLDRSDPPDIRVVLDEAALRRPVGGPAVMRGQVQHLIEMARRPNITIQVLPLQGSGFVAGAPFTVFKFADPDLPEVVYAEQLTSALYLDRPEVVSHYTEILQRLSAESLSPHESIQVLNELLGRFGLLSPA